VGTFEARSGVRREFVVDTSASQMPHVGHLLETSLYVEDLTRSVDFYQCLFGFEILARDNRFCALSISGEQVLLLFRKGASAAPIFLPGGVIPPHDGTGRSHLAFTIQAADEGAWEEHLNGAKVAIESRIAWPEGGISLYFRDPDGHLLELVTMGCWSIY
jgi:catechol 2,3-dioxygenase-like lactoylglutathione lyase family enzyme